MPNFKNLNLSTKILDALIKKGYTTPTPIQKQSIPSILEGKDLLGIAQTGTGKTAAFALPILDNLFRSDNKVNPNNVRTLILTPTRELASQIVDNIKLYGEDLHLKSGVIFGGVNISNQIRTAKQGFDILVATPGRLLDLINQGHLSFSQLEIFVLDEADRMLDMGFINDVKKIIAKLPKKKQTLFFSATMPKDVAVLANSILNDPVKVEVTPESTTVEKIDQRVNLVEKANKPLLLKSIIDNEDDKSLFLVFSKTKHGANRIVEFLDKQSVKTAAIHGNKSQAAREKALDGFKQGKIKVLIATDIAARGIDIVGITHVINYDIPNHPESYVHRIGRTARAGREGIAISFCDNSESGLLKDIEKVIKMKLSVDDTHPFHNVKASAAAKSSMDVRERPKSGYKSTPKPRQANKTTERTTSYFSENRRWKDGDSNRSRPARDVGRDASRDVRPAREFSGEERKPSFGGDRPQRGDRAERSNDRPAFRDKERSFENRGPRPSFGQSFGDNPKPRFNSEERPARDFKDRKPFGDRQRSDSRSDSRSGDRPTFRDNNRSFDDKRTPYSGDRKPRFNSEERPARVNFSDRKSSFGDRTRGDRNDRPAFRDKERSFEGRSSRPSFGQSFGDNPKPRFGGEGRNENRGETKKVYGAEGRIGRAFSKDRSKSDFGKPQGKTSGKASVKSSGAGFGGRKFDNKNSGGPRKPTRPRSN
jgi:ATP-dependent RNA helicase RhlE